MKVLQLPAIGRDGRFGNWLVHYLVGRCFADRNQAAIQTPNWIGEYLFKINDNRMEPPSPQVTNFEKSNPLLFGTFVLPPFYQLPHRVVDPCFRRDIVQSIFKWRHEWMLRDVPRVKCAIHVRRGDFLTDPGFPVVPVAVMLNEASHYGFEASDCEIVSEKYPHKSCIPNELGWLQDFMILMLAENVFVYPRSTFSQMAALIGNGVIYMPSEYTPGKSTCKYSPVNPNINCVFPTKNNNLE